MSRLTAFLAGVVVAVMAILAAVGLWGNLNAAQVAAIGAVAAVVAALATLAAVSVSLPPWIREQRMRCAGRWLAAEAHPGKRRLERGRKRIRELVMGDLHRLSIADLETIAVEAEKRRKGGFVDLARRHGLTITPNPDSASDILKLAQTSVEQFKAGKAAADAFIDAAAACAVSSAQTPIGAGRAAMEEARKWPALQRQEYWTPRAFLTLGNEKLELTSKTAGDGHNPLLRVWYRSRVYTKHIAPRILALRVRRFLTRHFDVPQ